jgi:cytochrome c oxidase cbb3-type subunit 2
LARVGGRYSDEWHRVHLLNPRDVVPESNMPAFTWLEHKIINSDLTPKKIEAFKFMGVPYTDEDIAGAKAAVEGKTELEAVVAYLQSLGLVLKDKR